VHAYQQQQCVANQWV